MRKIQSEQTTKTTENEHVTGSASTEGGIHCCDFQQRGLYLARQLSFRGVSFRVEEVPLSPEFIEIYDESVKLWLETRRQFQVRFTIDP